MNRLEHVRIMEVVVDDLPRLGQLATRESLQGPNKFVNLLARKPVIDVGPVLTRRHERYLPEPLQVSARIPYRETGLTGEPFHRLFPLRQKVQQEKPRSTPNGFPDAREVLEQLQLGSFQFHGSSAFKRIIVSAP